MSIIYGNELNDSNSSSDTVLSSIIDNSNILINFLDNASEMSSNYFSGKVYDVVCSRMSLYKDALVKQVKICTILKDNIKAANNTMLNYMEGYELLDDSKKDEIETLLNNINSSINELEIIKIDDTDLKTAHETNLYRLYLLKNALNYYYNKLSGLATKDSESYSMLEPVYGDIESYSKALSTITSAFGKNFYRLGNRDIMYYNQEGHEVDGNFIEWVSNWVSLGGNNIFVAGCCPTSFAIVVGTMLHDDSVTPETIADIMLENHITNSSNSIIYLSDLFGFNCEIGHFDPDLIESIINAGGAYIGTAEKGGHYVAVVDVVHTKDGQRLFVLCDPKPALNNNRDEPTLISAEDLHDIRRVSMNYYITPGNVILQKDDNERITIVGQEDENNKQ